MKRVAIVSLAILALAVLVVEPAIAGPGGKIASAAFETFWGRIALGALCILLLPLILYTWFTEKRSERRARKDLRFMAGYHPAFEWLQIQQRAKDCFLRVHSGWQQEDLSGVTQWMTNWYWQNQQMVYLDNWKQAGLVNVCNVKKINHIKPLLFVHKNQGAEHENSMLVISLTAHMNDYLQHRETGKIVEGSKRYKDVETIWSFVLEDGAWKVADIEEDTMSLAYAKMVKELPNIEATLVSELRA